LLVQRILIDRLWCVYKIKEKLKGPSEDHVEEDGTIDHLLQKALEAKKKVGLVGLLQLVVDRSWFLTLYVCNVG
jgi:hypothetical protein